MMRPWEPEDFAFDERPPPKLIRKPKKRSKLKSWFSYYQWWLSQQTVEFWMVCDCSQPFKRNK